MNLDITTQQGLTNLEYKVQIENFKILQEFNNAEHDSTPEELECTKYYLLTAFMSNLRFIAKTSIDNNLKCVTINDTEIKNLLALDQEGMDLIIKH